MTKLVLKEAYRKVGKRTYSLVQCPSCSSTRDVRVDTLKAQKATLCKPCSNRLRSKKDITEKLNSLDHYRTLEGHITAMRNAQRQRSKHNGWAEPAYSREELIEWVRNQPNASDLYTAWELSGYEKNRAPSIDRLDDYKPYSFDNIRLVTWEVNNQKGRADKVAGINTKGLTSVRQLDLNGNVIAEFHSAMAAQRQTGVNNSHIHNACRGYRMANGKQKNVLTAGGFKWQYI